MNLNNVLMFAVPTMIFACGAALLSHRFYAAYQRWPIGDFLNAPKSLTGYYASGFGYDAAKWGRSEFRINLIRVLK